MNELTTIAVLGDKPLEGRLRQAFPGFTVVGAKLADQISTLLAAGSVGLFATRVRGDGAAGATLLRQIARETVAWRVPAVFLAPSSAAAFRALGPMIAEPTVGVAYREDEVREVMNLLRRRAGQAPVRAGRTAEAPAVHSDLDGHPLIADTTGFLRNPDSGRLDARRIADFYGEPLKKFADKLGVTPPAVSQTPDSPKYQGLLGYFEKVARIAPLLENKASFGGWVKTPNRELKGETPLDLLWGGPARAQRMVDAVEDVLVGQPD